MADPLTAWLFAGQGAQQVGMGRDLYEGSDAAREIFETADAVLGYPISQRCFEGPEQELQETRTAQPAIYTMSFACLAAAREQGGPAQAAPACLAGHSLGEYTALAAAGAFEFQEGLRLVQERGRLMQVASEQNPGGMAALIGMEIADVQKICGETGAEVCNLNAPGQIVLGGTADAVDSAMSLALERGARRGIRLKVGGAFHTSLMEPAVEELVQAIEAASIRDPEVAVIANSTAQPMLTADEVRAELAQQILKPVLWQASIEHIAAQGVASVTEFGPGRVLTGLARRIDPALAIRNVSDLTSARSQATAAPSPP